MALRHLLAITGGLLMAPVGMAQDAAGPAGAGPEQASIFAISYRAGPNWKPGVPMERQGLRDHYFYWKALDAAGRVAVAGPVGPDAGLVLLYAKDQQEADRVVTDDPASKAGVFVGQARRFVPRFVGKTTLSPVRP